MMALRGVLRGLILLSVVFAAVIMVWPANADGTEQPVAELDATPSLPPPPLTADSLAMDIVMGNVFAVTRTPPVRRYTPPDSGAVDESMVTTSDPPPDAAVTMADGPALFGTVVGEGGSVMALLHLNPADPGPRLYAVGGRDGGYRVVSIAPRAVILNGPQGRVTLRLPDEERP